MAEERKELSENELDKVSGGIVKPLCGGEPHTRGEYTCTNVKEGEMYCKFCVFNPASTQYTATVLEGDIKML